MRPDATVVGEGGRVERIFDAKWKPLDAAVPNRGIGRDDIYQMASYAGGYGCDRLALLYPRGEGVAQGLVEAMEACGCRLNNAYMQHSLLALVVIPELRLSDKGLVDVRRFEVVSLFEGNE